MPLNAKRVPQPRSRRVHRRQLQSRNDPPVDCALPWTPKFSAKNCGEVFQNLRFPRKWLSRNRSILNSGSAFLISNCDKPCSRHLSLVNDIFTWNLKPDYDFWDINRRALTRRGIPITPTSRRGNLNRGYRTWCLSVIGLVARPVVPNPLPAGVTVARMTLDHSVLVRIQGGEFSL